MRGVGGKGVGKQVADWSFSVEELLPCLLTGGGYRTSTVERCPHIPDNLAFDVTTESFLT